MMSMLPKKQEEIAYSPNSIVICGIYRGTRKENKLLITFQMPLKFLNIRRGWEMKDVLTMPLPEEVRYKVLKDWEQMSYRGHCAYALFCED